MASCHALRMLTLSCQAFHHASGACGVSEARRIAWARLLVAICCIMQYAACVTVQCAVALGVNVSCHTVSTLAQYTCSTTLCLRHNQLVGHPSHTCVFSFRLLKMLLVSRLTCGAQLRVAGWQSAGLFMFLLTFGHKGMASVSDLHIPWW